MKPARVPATGGVFVEIEAYGDASPRGEPTCRFGLETVPARVVSSESFCSEYAVTIAEGQILPPGVYPTQNITLPHGQYARESVCHGWSRVTCEVPASFPGFASVAVGHRGGEFVSSDVTLIYQPEPTVRALQPSAGPASGVGVAKVTGDHLVESSTKCAFGAAAPVRGARVSSTLMKCEVPARDVGVAAFELSVGEGAHRHTRSGLVYEHLEEPRVVGIEPPQGPLEGGAMVRLSLRASPLAPENGNVSPCRFGTVWVTGHSFPHGTACSAPAHQGATVVVATSVNQGEVWTSSEVFFTYGRVDTRVLAVSPAAGPVKGGAVITVYASGLRAERGVVCRVGMEVFEGRYVGAVEACGDPPRVLSAPSPPPPPPPAATNVTAERACSGYRVLWQEIRCRAPTYHPGVTTVEVSDVFGVFSDSKVEFEYQAAARVFALSPPTGPAGGSTVVVVSGENLASAHGTLCGFGDADVSRAEVISSVMIKCESPAHPEGVVAVEASVGDEGQTFTTSGAAFAYEAPAELRGADPTEGSVGGGTAVTIQTDDADGTRLFACRFGAIAPVAARRVSENRARCVSPAGRLGSTRVDVTDNLVDYSTAHVEFTYWPDATVLALEPAAGPVAGGTLVTVTGVGLKDAATCRFGDVVVEGAYVVGSERVTLDRVAFDEHPSAANASESPTRWVSRATLNVVSRVVCRAPPAAAGRVAIEISNARGDFSADGFDFEFRPVAVVIAASPALGSTEGSAIVRLVGRHLAGARPLCVFGSAPPTSAAEISSALVACESPSRVEGVVSLEVSASDEGRTFTTSGVAYEYVPPLAVRGVDPDEGSVEGGASVTIRTDAPSRVAACAFGTIAPVRASASSDGHYSCASPAMDVGAVRLRVTENLAEYTSTSAAFRYVPAAEVLSAWPSSGPAHGGTVVTLVGRGVGEGTSCRFGEAIVAATVESGDARDASVDAHLRPTETVFCRAPPLAAGHVGVEITRAHGRSLRSLDFHYAAPAEIFGVAPDVGPVEGSTVVVVAGRNLRGAAGTRTLCGFGAATPSEAAEISSALVACESPARVAGVVSVEVSAADEGQQFTAAGVVFEFGDFPATRGASPARGSAEGGVLVAIHVDAAEHIGRAACRFGTVAPVLARRDRGAAMLCASPARVEGAAALETTFNLVDYSVGAASFKYGHAAVAADVYPSTGPASGGTEILAVVESMDDAEPTCVFGAVAVRAEVVERVQTCGERLVATTNGIYSDAAGTDALVSPGRRFVTASRCVGHVVLRCVTPVHFPGVVSFDVDFGGGDAVSFGFDVDAEVRSLSPAVGPVAGSTVVHLAGRHMLHDRDPLCAFGADAPARAEFVSSALMKCEASAAGEGFASAEVSVSGGDVFTADDVAFEYVPEPALVSLDRVEGSEIGGETICVGVDDARSARDVTCRVGVLAPVAGRLVGDARVECLSPAHAPRAVPVRLSVNRVDHTADELAYAYARRVTVLSAYPAASRVRGGATVTVAGRGFAPGRTECRFGDVVVPASAAASDGVAEVCAPRAESFALVGGRVASAHRVRPPTCVGWSTVTCEAPTAAAGWTSLDVRVGEGRAFFEDSADFEFVVGAEVRSLSPASGPSSGGTVVHVASEHAADRDGAGPACRFGVSPPHDAAFVSSALVKCESPASDEGSSAVEVSDDEARVSFSESGVRFAFAAATRPMGHLGAASSDERGGALIRVVVAETLDAGATTCRVGTLAPIAARDAAPRETQCVAPARAPGVVDLDLASNLVDVTGAPLAFAYARALRVHSVVPASAARGGEEVVVRGVGFAAADALACRFGDVLAPARKLGAIDGAADVCEKRGRFGACVGWEAIACVAPESPPGFVAFDVTGAADATRFEVATFAFDVAPRVFALAPTAGPASGGTVVHLAGAHARDGDSTLCAFGGAPVVAARVTSSALATCETPAREEGAAAAAMIDGGMVESPAVFEFLPATRVLSVAPDVGSELGGGAFVIAGANLAPGGVAKVGTVAPVAARFVSEEAAEAVAPARIAAGPASVPVEFGPVGAGSNAWSVDGARYTFARPATPEAATLDASTTAGGAMVVLFGSGMYRRGDAPWACRFGDVRVDAVETSHRLPAEACAAGRCLGWSAVACAVPPGPPGFTTLGVAVGAETPFRNDVEFAFDVAAAVATGFPNESPSEGGGLVFVLGSNLRPGNARVAPLCQFGSAPPEGAPAVVVSSALMLCEAPERPEGLATLSASVTDGGATWSASAQGAGGSAGVTHYFSAPVRVTGASPTTGPENGGTVIGLRGVGFEDGPRLACRFGTTYPVRAAFVGSDLIECISPSADAGKTIPLGSTGNGRDYTPGGGLFGSTATFNYFASLRVTGVTPRSGVTGGRTPVFVTGVGFINSTLLSCRLGREVVAATYLSPFSILCIAPEQPTGAGTVFIEVSNNGEDWTSERTLFHFAPCPAGYYCPEGEPLPCPRGAFCSGGSGGAANFTLCPVGTFQPRTTQSSCLPAPIGFIAPDVGTSVPSVCPRGAVCDVTGLSGPSKQCPPGHYCLEGTRTSNFTDFGTPERPLPCPFGTYCGPGVTTNRTIANNFTTPQTCFAGFMCEPGSATPQGSGPCPSGHYCPPGQLIPCPKRTYCPGVANTEPKPCVPGLYQQEYGQSTCKKCPLGTICPGFARELPEACPPGFVCDEVGLPIPAKRCPAGHYCLSNTLTPDPLSALDTDQLLRSSPIVMRVDQFRPLPCLPATYCMEGVMSNITNEGVFTQPQPCKEGSYCEWATSDKTFAVAGDVSSPMFRCPPGNYCPKGTYIPIPAPRGFFAPGEGNSQPAMCLPGYYTHYEGFQTCLACPAGYECSVDGTYKPLICRSGTVRSLRDSITCKNCPMGTWNPFRGVTDESLCIPCNPGLVCSAEGTENNKPFGDNVQQVVNQFILPCEEGLDTCESVELQPLGRATLCPEGYVCDARTSVAAVKCPDGYFCGYGTSPETQFFNKCPAGYFCPEGTAASGRYQFPCSACHYCPEGTGVILPRCPEGTQSDPNAENIDQCIADRITFWRIQPLKRVLIDEAYAMLLLAYNESTSDRRRSLLELGEGAEADRIGGVYKPKAHKYDQDISYEAVQKLGEYVAALPREETYVEEMGRRRRLLQDAAAADAPAANVTEGDNTTTVATGFDTTYFGECKGENFDLLNPTFIMDANGEPAVDIQGTPMVKYTLPRGYMAKIKFDWRFIDDFIRHGQQYELSLFVDDRVNDMMCDEADFEKVPCPPWDTGDGVNRKTMGSIPGREFEEKCPKSTEALELPFWFKGNGLPGGNEHNVLNPEMGTYVWKRGLHEINIGGLEEITFRFEVRMLHGLYQNATRRGFLDTMCIETLYPTRGSAADKSSFHVILENNDALQIPLNVPFREPFQRSIELDYFLCSEAQMDPSCRYIYPSVTLDYNSTLASEWKKYIKQEELEAQAGMDVVVVEDSDAGMTDDVIIEENGDMHVPDVVERQEYIFTEDYWTQGRPLLAVDYLPFFSGCRGFDSHIYFYYLTETAWTEIEDFVNYGSCDLIPVNETIFIDQWAPQVAAAVADSCEVEIQCFYEETYKEAAASTRWFEVEGDTLFHITQEAESQDALFEASVLANDQTEPEVNTGTYEAAVAAQESIPVSFTPAEGVEVVRGIIPTSISIAISYFQFTPTDKRMISAEGEFDEYVNAKKHDGTYLLTLTMDALGWFDLLNFFAFEQIFYVVLFHALGLVSVTVVVGFWAITRLFTTLKDPPRFRFTQYLGIVTAAPSRGIILAMIPFMTAQFTITFLIENFSFLTQFPISIDNLGREIDQAVVAQATAGRMALAFLTVSCYLMTCAAEILVPNIPEMDTIREADEESVMQPEGWKRSHYIVMNVLINITNIALMEFSFTDTYGMYFFVVFLLMKVFHILLEMQAEAFLGEVMLLTPISVGLSLTAGLVTIAADDFTDFTMGYYLELIIGLIEFVYLDAFIAYMSKLVPALRRRISLRLRLRRARNIKQQLLGDKINEEDSVVEDLMGFLTAYGTSTAGLYMTPFFIYFYWAFNDYLQLSFLFGFRKKDLLIYLLFALVIIPFQIVMDIFIFNIQELFHGWKVYEYMKYARYRFNNRTARWKGLEKTFDESIDYSLRTVDQMCFSSQFYFILGIGGSGSFLFVLAISMMLRAKYNMFEDILFGLVVAIILGLCVIGRKVFLTIADVIGLWKISASQMDDGMIHEEDLPTDFRSFDRAKDLDEDTERSGRGEFSMADLTTDTFRRKFLEHNRMWLIDQLAELLTPRTAKKFRKAGGMMKIRGAGSLSDSDSDEGDRERFEEDVELTEPSERVLRMWLHEARKRSRGGRFARAAAGLSETSDSEAERAPKFPPVTLSAEASALIKGWLAATRAVREARGDRPVGELSSSDTDGEGVKWGVPVLLPASQRLLRDWLERARARNHNAGRQKSALYSDSENSSEDGFGRVTALRPASTRIMLQWLGQVRAQRGVRDDPELRMLREFGAELSSGSDSDDLGGRRFDDRPVVVSENAQRLVKWWLQNLRRQMADEGEAGGAVPADDVSDDEDSFEDSSDDSFPTSPVGGGGGGPMVTSSDQFRSGTDGFDDDEGSPGSGSSGDSVLDSSD